MSPNLPVTDSDDDAMSTRSKSRLAAGSTPKAAAPAPVKQSQKAKSKSAQAIDQLGKENVKVQKSSKKPVKKESRAVLCMCEGGDDGSPMVYCGQCKIW